jgi:hypothetical protein
MLNQKVKHPQELSSALEVANHLNYNSGLDTDIIPSKTTVIPQSWSFVHLNKWL